MKLKPGKERILTISDLQAPFQHRDALAFLKTLKKEIKPTITVCCGDEVDFHALSNYDHDPDGYSAGHELEEFMKGLYKLFPEVKAVTSNHTARPFRKAYKFGLPRKFLRDYKEFLEAPEGWEWRDKWIVDEILFEHGEGVSGKNAALTKAERNGRSTVIGHVHSHAGVQYHANSEELFFGMNTGCLIDNDAYAFAYGKHARYKPIIGTGIVMYGVPIFVPMILNKKGRWIGRLG